MRFVTVTHAEIGEARVPESTVPHLPAGWTVVDDQAAAESPTDDSTLDPPAEIETETPTPRATRARTSRKES